MIGKLVDLLEDKLFLILDLSCTHVSVRNFEEGERMWKKREGEREGVIETEDETAGWGVGKKKKTQEREKKGGRDLELNNPTNRSNQALDRLSLLSHSPPSLPQQLLPLLLLLTSSPSK